MNSITVGTGSEIETPSAEDTGEVTEVFTDERACAVTLNDPVAVQVCEADVAPVASHPELVPSPQLNRYCTEYPRLSTDPPVEYVYAVPATPLVVPLGVLGVDTVSGGSEMVTDSPPEVPETTEVFAEERACAVTLNDPVAVQVCEAEVVPTASHPELVPSPQLIRYCTEYPRLSTDPPVEYAYAVPATPLVVPLGTLGVDTVSGGSEMVTDSAPEVPDVTEVFTADRACAVTEYVFAVDQLCEADVVPVASHPELVPSPQLNRYCTA
jgi:hypothetical protein